MIGRDGTRGAGGYRAEKAIAAIGFLIQQTGADLYSVMKLVYLADKIHLGRYGRTITGDAYTAMENGPVPERSYNLCKFVAGRRSHFDPLPSAREKLRLNGNDFELVSAPDLADLSRTDVEALAEVAALHRAGGWRAVRKASHDAAWLAAWDEARARGIRSIDMDLNAIAATLENGPALIEYLADPCPGEAPRAQSAA